ncbi:MAG: rhomboid family intramembrane serine protease [Clostridia bacterium]|nr:rhomboid family intramembrane serine protease [Clostridia bacterium]
MEYNDDNTVYEGQVVSENKASRFPKPKVTYFFIWTNIIIWILMTLSGGSTNTEVLIKFGAKVNQLISTGEYWRLITPIFLHVGIMHLVFNCYALYNIGPIVELLFGSGKFVFIYMIAGIGGSLLSFAFTENMSAGASGAIFGLMGALIYFGINKKEVFRRIFGINLYLIIGINLFIGFTTSGIDNFGHIGGLLAGFFAAAAVGLKDEKGINLKKVVFILVTFIILWGTFMFGLNQNSYHIALEQAVENYEAGDLEQAEKYAKSILKDDPQNLRAKYVLGVTYYAQGNPKTAKTELLEIIQIDQQYAPAYYTLGWIYIDEGDVQKAKQSFENALKYNPELSEARQILERLE